MLLPFITKHKEIYFPQTKIRFQSKIASEILALKIALSSESQEILFFPRKKTNISNGIENSKDLLLFGALGKVKLIKQTKTKIEVEISFYSKVMLQEVFPHEKNMNLNVMASFSKLELPEIQNKEEVELRLIAISQILEQIGLPFEQVGLDIFKNGSIKNISHKNVLKTIAIIIDVISMPFEIKYDLFTTHDILKQLNQLIDEFDALSVSKELDEEIDEDIRRNLDNQQREFILREKIKVIRKKLGEDKIDDEEEFLEKINSKQGKFLYPEQVQKNILAEKRRLKGMMTTSPEANITRTYLDWLQNLPWRKIILEDLDIKNAKKTLDQNHFGLKEVKERIIEFIAVLKKKKQLSKEKSKNLISLGGKEAIDKTLFSNDKGFTHEVNNVPIITLIGPPGTGKTSLAKAIADGMGRKFVKISLGGVKDESEIRGHRRTYVGAMPGKIIQAIKKAGVSNPLILLDEIDKMASDYKGDPASAMLEVLDPEQNAHFQDHYLEVEYDLSKVLFLATANYIEGIPEPLADRVEIIELSSYTLLEKVKICRDYLIDKTLEQNSLEPQFFQISDKNIELIIKKYTREAGVRELKRVLDKIARKIVLMQIEKKMAYDSFTIDAKIISQFLGVEKFSDDENENQSQIGAVNGLAYTQYGGSTLAIEVVLSSGKGELKLTGQLKDVMQESAQIALSYVRSNAEDFAIKNFDWDNTNIHIHVPEGAVPKDGPSAGVTFTTAIISALTKKPISHKVGMTGEITLRGKVLGIGGLKEKSLAAYKYGINKVFIPKENEKNIQELSEQVKEGVKFIPVSNYQEIYKALFK